MLRARPQESQPPKGSGFTRTPGCVKSETLGSSKRRKQEPQPFANVRPRLRSPRASLPTSSAKVMAAEEKKAWRGGVRSVEVSTVGGAAHVR